MSGLPARVEGLLTSEAIVRVATVASDGAPSAAPFWFHWDGERIVLDTLENATVRNLRCDARCAVLVDRGRWFDELEAATIDGVGRVFAPAVAPAAVVEAVEALRANHAAETASEVFEAYAAGETRASVFVEITPGRAQYWSGRQGVERRGR